MSEKDEIVAVLRAAIPPLRQRWPIFETYLADEKTRYAVMRGYEIMGKRTDIFPTT